MTQPYSFNLVDEAWLPCVWLDGTTVTLSLRDTLTQAHQLQSLVGDSPPQTAALHRFLLAILHRVFGPEDEDAWAVLWQAKAFDANRINEYLDKWQHRFDLFDVERPFYQSATLYLESNWVSINRLVHDLNAAYPLFNHAETTARSYLTPSEVARAIITAQGFSLCGTSGAFFPQKSPRDKKIQGMFVDGSIARAINFLIQGDKLFETLMLNLIQYPDDDVIVHFDDDAPSWELDDPASPERHPLMGYLDYLTWQNRRILLQPELDIQGKMVIHQMRWEPANRLEASLLDTMQHHFVNKKEGYQSLYFNEDKSLWRDSGSLFSLHHRDGTLPVNLPPATFRWLQGLTTPGTRGFEKRKQYRCLALGMSSKPGQATVYFYREDSMPLPLDYFQKPELVHRLQDALNHTEKVFANLRFAMQMMGMYLREPGAESKTWKGLNRLTKQAINDWVAHTGAERHYWASLDIPFQTFIVELPQQDQEVQLLNWLKRLQTIAHVAFEQAAQCVSNDARAIKATVRGRSYLNYHLNQLIPKEETKA